MGSFGRLGVKGSQVQILSARPSDVAGHLNSRTYVFVGSAIVVWASGLSGELAIQSLMEATFVQPMHLVHRREYHLGHPALSGPGLEQLGFMTPVDRLNQWPVVIISHRAHVDLRTG